MSTLKTDLFGMEVPTKRTNDRPEVAALCEVLKALKAHPAVSWCERMNSGVARVGGRFIRFGFTGCPDVLGMLRPEQTVFLSASVRVVACHLWRVTAGT